MEEDDLPPPPFWLQSSSNDNTPHRATVRRLQRQASSIFLNSGILLVVLLVMSFAFVFVVVPSLINFTSQVFRPNLIKKSFDSLIMALVLFAVVCGLFLPKDDNNSDHAHVTEYDHTKSSSFYPSTPSGWYVHDHHQVQDRPPNYNTMRRSRSFDSYPDLRKESIERWQLSQEVYHHHDQNQEFSKKQEHEQNQTARAKDVAFTASFVQQKEVVCTPPPQPPPLSSPPPSPTPPQSPSPNPTPPLSAQPQPSTVVRRNAKRVYEDRGHKSSRREGRAIRSEKHKGEYFFNPFKVGKKKKKRSETRTSKAILIIPPPSPLPSPPPTESRPSRTPLTTSHKAPKRGRAESLSSVEENTASESGSSPLILVPPPGPLAPFQMSVWEFALDGDYVRVGSFDSSPSGSSDLESVDEDTMSEKGQYSNPMRREDDGARTSSSPPWPMLFSLSPDVNTKADNFIKRTRARLTFEKMNSLKGKSTIGSTEAMNSSKGKSIIGSTEASTSYAQFT